MKAKNEYGVTLLVLTFSIIIMLIIASITLGYFNPDVFRKTENIENDAHSTINEQEKEAQNAINALGGIR